MLSMEVNQTHLQKAATCKHNKAQKSVLKTELYCSGLSHFFPNKGDCNYSSCEDANLLLFTAITNYGERKLAETEKYSRIPAGISHLGKMGTQVSPLWFGSKAQQRSVKNI